MLKRISLKKIKIINDFFNYLKKTNTFFEFLRAKKTSYLSNKEFLIQGIQAKWWSSTFQKRRIWTEAWQPSILKHCTLRQYWCATSLTKIRFCCWIELLFPVAFGTFAASYPPISIEFFAFQLSSFKEGTVWTPSDGPRLATYFKATVMYARFS